MKRDSQYTQVDKYSTVNIQFQLVENLKQNACPV